MTFDTENILAKGEQEKKYDIVMRGDGDVTFVECDVGNMRAP